MDTNKKIMIIDDELTLSDAGISIQAQGFEVKIALDGFAALKVVHEFKPDLIILDINMPKMGGIEFYYKICGTNGKPLYPVLVLTARANIQGLFQDLQIDGFIIKPFEIDQLIQESILIIKRSSQNAPEVKLGLSGVQRKICIVDNDEKTFDHLSHLFFNADFTVVPARSGAKAIEKMMKDVPDVAIVHLGLTDIPGDIVIYRLSQMSKTMDVKFVLYTSKTIEHDDKVMERISVKTGIWTFVEYNTLEEIFLAVNQVLPA